VKALSLTHTHTHIYMGVCVCFLTLINIFPFNYYSLSYILRVELESSPFRTLFISSNWRDKDTQKIWKNILLINGGGTHLLVGPTISFFVCISPQTAISIYFKQMERILTPSCHFYHIKKFVTFVENICSESFVIFKLFQ